MRRDDTPPTAEDLRMDLARIRPRRWLYEIAPEVGLHPARLGEVLNGRRPLSPDLARRIRAAIRGEERVE